MKKNFVQVSPITAIQVPIDWPYESAGDIVYHDLVTGMVAALPHIIEVMQKGEGSVMLNIDRGRIVGCVTQTRHKFDVK